MIFVTFSAISLLIFIYPYVIYPQILRLFPADKNPVQNENSPLSFALFFSAYNEEANILRTIKWMRALKKKWPEIEIWAYDDCSNDQTPEHLKAAQDVISLIRGTSVKASLLVCENCAQ